MDTSKCENCPIPVNYCDGLTRYKCGEETEEVEKFCIYEKYMKD